MALLTDNLGPAARRALYKRLLLRLVLLVLGALFSTLLLPRIFSLLLPFIIALLIAMALNPLVSFLQRRFHVPRRVSAVILDALAVTAVFSLLGWFVYTIASQATALATNLPAYLDDIMQGFDSLEGWLGDILPADVGAALDEMQGTLRTWLQSASSDLLKSTLQAAGSLTSRVGSWFTSAIVAFLAVYFMTAEYREILAFMRRKMGRRARKYLGTLKTAVFAAFGGYFKSQILLALFAFSVMAVALTIYGQKYSILIAFLLGIVDFLPIVGTIAVLLPWGLIEWIIGNVPKAAFLILLGAGYTVVRKIVEPKIVGSQTGLHPLVALMSIFVGLRVAGVLGAIIGPVVFMVFLNLKKAGLFDNTIADLRDLLDVISLGLKRPKN